MNDNRIINKLIQLAAGALPLELRHCKEHGYSDEAIKDVETQMLWVDYIDNQIARGYLDLAMCYEDWLQWHIQEKEKQ